MIKKWDWETITSHGLVCSVVYCICPPFLVRYFISFLAMLPIWNISIDRRYMYILHQLLVLCKCHKLDNFIFRFSFYFSPVCSLLSSSIISALKQTLLIWFWDFSNSPFFVKDHIVLWCGRLPEVFSPRGIIRSLRQLWIFLAEMYIFFIC